MSCRMTGLVKLLRAFKKKTKMTGFSPQNSPQKSSNQDLNLTNTCPHSMVCEDSFQMTIHDLSLHAACESGSEG